LEEELKSTLETKFIKEGICIHVNKVRITSTKGDLALVYSLVLIDETALVTPSKKGDWRYEKKMTFNIKIGK
jgi:hypothetical protein